MALGGSVFSVMFSQGSLPNLIEAMQLMEDFHSSKISTPKMIWPPNETLWIFTNTLNLLFAKSSIWD
jgi:hypothetical protein